MEGGSAELGVSLPAAAMAFSLRSPLIDVTIVGVTNTRELDADLECLTLGITDEELQSIADAGSIDPALVWHAGVHPLLARGARAAEALLSPVEEMVAVVVREPGRMEVDLFPIPAPGADEALIAMETASICGSDVHVLFDGWAREDAIGRPGTRDMKASGRSSSRARSASPWGPTS